MLIVYRNLQVGSATPTLNLDVQVTETHWKQYTAIHIHLPEREGLQPLTTYWAVFILAVVGSGIQFAIRRNAPVQPYPDFRVEVPNFCLPSWN